MGLAARSRRTPRAAHRTALAGALALSYLGASSLAATTPAATTPATTATDQQPESLAPVVVSAPEPRYVAPTRRDRIGRIWAPVFINGKGPFRLVLDSGASTSGITMQVVRALGLTVDPAHRILLRGVVGLATVPLVRIQSLTAGDLSFGTTSLAVVTDALGGADGILGTDGMGGRRILIDFRHDLISITRSHRQHAPAGYVTIPFKLMRNELVVADAWVGNVRAQAIIDTGGQVTIANLALRTALENRRSQLKSQPEQIEDVTKATQSGDSADAPPILLGKLIAGDAVKISNDRLTFGDMHIFEHWGMTRQPAMLIGMDTLGRLDTLIIDYRLRELQIRLIDPGSPDAA